MTPTRGEIKRMTSYINREDSGMIIDSSQVQMIDHSLDIALNK